MTKKIYDQQPPSWKREKAAEIMEWRLRGNVYFRVETLPPKEPNGGIAFREVEVMHKIQWRPDLDLNQTRLIIEKAKENMDVWVIFDSKLHNISFGKEPYRSFGCFNANIAALSADEILFCLFQAFGEKDL